jgi:hypothetical protein
MSNNALTRTAGALALLEAANAAGYAPSIHDTQPWRWRLIGNVLDLHLERDRVRTVSDPDARLATLSCGVALHHARVALAAQGWRVSVVRLPDRVDPDHLAQVHIEGRTPVDPRSILHLRTVPFRHTDRRPVTAKPVDPGQVQVIAAAVTAEHTWLHVLTPDQVLELASAADHAQRAETEDSAWRSELAYWTGANRPAGTGNPDAASAEHDTAAVFVVLYGNADEPPNWLRAGEALSAGWLTATEHGVSVLPHSAPIEVLGTRQAMRVILAGTGYPYLVLRLGTIDSADAGPPEAPRLPADQTIDRS